MKARIYELDGLRAIAIILVIFSHYEAYARLLGGLSRFGWIGVDIFFVLSGYLITSILLQLKTSEHPFRDFYFRRCFRILPPLSLALIAVAVACLFTGDHAFFSVNSLVKNGLFLQSFRNPNFLLHPHIPSLHPSALPLSEIGMSGPMSKSAAVLWSLSIEEWFYLLWAPVVLWFSRKSVIAIAIAICVVEFAFRLFFFTGMMDHLSIFHRFDALIYGAFVALFIGQLKARRWIPRTLFVVSASLVAVIIWAIRPVLGREIRSSVIFMGFGLTLISICVASIISMLVISANSRNPINAALRFAPVRLVGTISYTLYLIHVLVYLLLTKLLGVGMAVALTATALSMMAAFMSWRFIESPLLQRKSSTSQQRDATETRLDQKLMVLTKS